VAGAVRLARAGARRCRVGVVERADDRIASIDPNPEQLRNTAMSRCARLSGTRERRSVMITTLLVIVASIAAGMIVSRVHPEYRKW
jgi:hypothetical protein